MNSEEKENAQSPSKSFDQFLSRPTRSTSADGIRTNRSPMKVSFNDETMNIRRARSTTPTRQAVPMNPEYERLLFALTNSEADIAQITKQLSFVKDILIRLKLVSRRATPSSEFDVKKRNNEIFFLQQNNCGC